MTSLRYVMDHEDEFRKTIDYIQRHKADTGESKEGKLSYCLCFPDSIPTEIEDMYKLFFEPKQIDDLVFELVHFKVIGHNRVRVKFGEAFETIGGFMTIIIDLDKDTHETIDWSIC